MKQKAFQLPAEVLYLNVQGSKTKFSSFYYGSSVLLVTQSLNSRVIFYSFSHHVARMCSIYSEFLPSIPRQCILEAYDYKPGLVTVFRFYPHRISLARSIRITIKIMGFQLLFLTRKYFFHQKI